MPKQKSTQITLSKSNPTQNPVNLPVNLAALIDHTLLKADASPEDISQLCQEACEHHFAAVCVNSAYIHLVVNLLKGSSVKVAAVVGFPLGASTSASKAFEAREAIQAGADEIDMVIQLGALKAGDYSFVYSDLLRVVEAARPFPVKVILETGCLSEEQKIVACALAKAAGAAFVKTSTGFGPGGATTEDVALMRRMVGSEMGVKASGGIRTYEDAVRMVQAGANRLGTSAGVALVAAEKGIGK